MAGYRDINGASQIVRRNVQAVDLQQDNRTALESVMVAMAAGGRVQEMALIAQTLEKVNTNASLADAITELKTVVSGIATLNQKELSESPQAGMKAANTVLDELRAENAELRAMYERVQTK
jgi:hypothetical protein